MSSLATSGSLWTKDRLWALGAILFFAIASFIGLTRDTDRLVFHAFSEISPAHATQRINIIAIDKRSLNALGQLPWPRNTLARLLNIAAMGKPKVMALTLPLENSQISPGFTVVDQLTQAFKKDGLKSSASALGQLAQQLPPKTAGSLTPLGQALDQFDTQLHTARDSLNQDKQLMQSLAANTHTDLAFRYARGITQGVSESPLSAVLLRNRLQLGMTSHTGAAPPSAYTLTLPLPQFLENALGVGALNGQHPDGGAYTGTPTVINYYGHLFPSLALLVAMQSLNLKGGDVHYLADKGLELGTLLVHTDSSLRIHPATYASENGRSAFTTYSFIDVLNGSISPRKFHDKILLIGPTTNRLTNTPHKANPLDFLADEISSMLNQAVIYTPDWERYLNVAVWGFIILYLVGIQPSLSDRLGGGVSHGMAIALLLASFYGFHAHRMWLSPTGPVLLLLGTFWIIYFKNRLFGETGLLKGTNTNLENLKMLGLAYQNQGQLDLAFDRYRQLPTTGDSLDLLYNLGLDFERKRRFDKAHGVYEYITLQKRGYRDIQERMKRTQTLSDITLTPHNPSGTHQNTIILNTNGLQKPILGRYEVEREIGRGAMSIVYEGKDPKIGRRVAIKTLPLSTEFRGADLEQVKARFNREANTAGQLNHPNIVTIYDAGEEDDMAYIAMEYLEGKNLTHFFGPSTLLPISTVLEIVAKCALALDYAHRHQVIHRDVKPANIVYNAKTGEVKLTDFGIARITDASKTRTGVIMGTPSYMSPEQLAGRNLDGRSDLFSLGITCFHLLTGAPPFHADTMATLMYKITNEAHPALNALRDDLAPCVSPIINKVLQKNPDKRYQTGREFANQLLRCARHIREQTA